jgi:phosphoglycolate phosphatase-like HAD superfamily hydrolase
VKIDTLIFDMDGVITTEEKYWACARLTLWELVTQTLSLPNTFGNVVHDSASREALVPDDLIYALKGHAVNSNWDITYVLACVYLTGLSDATVLSAVEVDDFLQAIRDTLATPTEWPKALSDFLASTHGAKGRALIQEAGLRLERALGFSDNDELLRIDGPFWWYLHARFQRWYSGEAMQQFGAPPLTDGTVIPSERIEATLSRLQAAGYILGAATGRPRDELDDALGHLKLLNYFDPSRLSTLDMIRASEKQLGVSGLVKPHPFSLLRAIYPRADAKVLLDEEYQKMRRENVVVIGDSTSDILMGRSAGCRTVGVLSGVRGDEARQERYHLLVSSGCEAILDDMTELPDWLEGQQEDEDVNPPDAAS